jgi:hypothetical protein
MAAGRVLSVDTMAFAATLTRRVGKKSAMNVEAFSNCPERK